MSDDAPGLADERRRWRWPFSWLGVLALAWIVYELTANPALGAVAVCVKFGWEDFRTAFWLRRNDLDGWRRRATFWLYFAWGLWKTALVAFLMCVAFAAVAPGNAPPGGGPGAALLSFAGTFLTALAGFTACTLVTTAALEVAWLGGARLWLDVGAHAARRADHWPPTRYCAWRTNKLGQLLWTALFVWAGLGLLLLIALLVAVGLWPAGPFLWAPVVLGAPLLLGLARNAVVRAVQAATPEDCWGDDPHPDLPADDGEAL